MAPLRRVGLHKNVSLLALVVLAIHILTVVVDSYAPVHLIDAFVPFISGDRPIWLGLGALAFDLMIAVIVTSLLRDRIGLRTWRAVHWTAYASWPLAIVHGIGTGSDTKLGWVLVLNGTVRDRRPGGALVAVGVGLVGFECRSPQRRARCQYRGRLSRRRWRGRCPVPCDRDGLDGPELPPPCSGPRSPARPALRAEQGPECRRVVPD